MIGKTPKGEYRVRIYHRGVCVGDKTFPRKKDADAWEAEQKRALRMGSVATTHTTTARLGDVIDQFNKARRGAVRENVWDTDETNLRLHVPPTMKSRPIASISHGELEDLYASLLLTKSRPTVTRFRDSLSAVFTWATTHHLIRVNEVRKSRVPHGPDQETAKPLPFTEVEMLEVIAEARKIGELYAQVIEFKSLTGLRWGELCELRFSDVIELPYPAILITRSQSDGRKVTKTKGRNKRRVPLIDAAQAIIDARRVGCELNDRIFVNSANNKLNGPNFKRGARWDEVGKGRRIHDLRHTAATHWLRAGVDIKTVSAWLGHSSTNVTLDTYVHYMQADSDLSAMTRLSERRSALRSTGDSGRSSERS